MLFEGAQRRFETRFKEILRIVFYQTVRSNTLLHGYPRSNRMKDDLLRELERKTLRSKQNLPYPNKHRLNAIWNEEPTQFLNLHLLILSAPVLPAVQHFVQPWWHHRSEHVVILTSVPSLEPIRSNSILGCANKTKLLSWCRCSADWLRTLGA